MSDILLLLAEFVVLWAVASISVISVIGLAGLACAWCYIEVKERISRRGTRWK